MSKWKKIPLDLVINWDQTGMPVSSRTMAEERSKRAERMIKGKLQLFLAALWLVVISPCSWHIKSKRGVAHNSFSKALVE